MSVASIRRFAWRRPTEGRIWRSMERRKAPYTRRGDVGTIHTGEASTIIIRGGGGGGGEGLKPKRSLYHWAQLVAMFGENFCVEALRMGHIEQIVIVWKRQGDGVEEREVMYYTTVVMCDPY